MTQLYRGVGQMAQSPARHPRVQAGASGPGKDPEVPRKGPGMVRILTATARKPIICKTCKGGNCVGRCRF